MFCLTRLYRGQKGQSKDRDGFRRTSMVREELCVRQFVVATDGCEEPFGAGGSSTRRERTFEDFSADSIVFENVTFSRCEQRQPSRKVSGFRVEVLKEGIQPA